RPVRSRPRRPSSAVWSISPWCSRSSRVNCCPVKPAPARYNLAPVRVEQPPAPRRSEPESDRGPVRGLPGTGSRGTSPGTPPRRRWRHPARAGPAPCPRPAVLGKEFAVGGRGGADPDAVAHVFVARRRVQKMLQEAIRQLEGGGEDA